MCGIIISLDLADWISAISTAVAALAALIALTAWKKQKKSDLAETIILHARELTGALEWARYPVSYSSEGKTRERNEGETQDTSSQKDTYFVPIERLQKNNELLSKTYPLKLRAALHFSGVEALFDQYIAIIRNIQMAAGKLIRNYGTPYGNKTREENENIIWDNFDDDPVTKQIKDLPTLIEGKLKKYL